MLNKKASLYDSISGPMYLMVIAITMFIAYYIWATFVVNFTPIATNINISATQNLTHTMTQITGSIVYLDYMFSFLVLGLLLVSLIFAFKTGASVIYAYISLFMWILALLMSIVFENIFEIFATTFVEIGGVYTIVSFTMTNIKWIALAWCFVISVVMFTRSQSEDRQLMAADQVFTK